MLDERFRHRIARVAAGPDMGLSDEVRERILKRVAEDGPGIVRRARRLRVAFVAAGPVLAAAAAVAVFVGTQHREGAGELARSAGQTHAVSSGKAGSSAVAKGGVAPACASRNAPAGAAAGFVAGARLDLGAVALAVASSGAAVRLDEATACRTVIGLDAGRVSVHAKDLGGGALDVRARDAKVSVRGTIFAVTQSPDALLVEVAEGRVAVEDRTGVHQVASGERFTLSASGGALEKLGAARDGELRAEVGEPKIVGFDSLPAADEVPQVAGAARAEVPRGAAPSAPREALELEESAEAPSVAETSPKRTPVDLLAEADRARHDSDFARARQLYKQAAHGSGATAEAAWVALARMELSLGNAAAAREATKQRRDHFGQGTLAPEALWIDVRTYRQTGDLGRARELAKELTERWPSSPQAAAARQWLSGG